jgi:HD-GYP domain-containing protein (c-di-GMP phosphodiesterase class II)
MTTESTTLAPGSTREAAEQIVVAFARAMKNVSFYQIAHPVVEGILADTAIDLGLLLERQPEFVIKFSSGYVVIQDAPVLNQNASIGNLVGACHRRGVDTIVLRKGVTQEELSHLIEVLAMEPPEVEAAGGAQRALSARGVRLISIQKLVSRAETSQSLEQSADLSAWSWVYTTAIDVIRSAATEVRTGGSMDIGSVQQSVREIVDDSAGDRSIVYSLNWMKGMDEYTFIHALHICILAIELGRKIGLSNSQLEEVGTATLLHDVGKIFVPLEILRKPAKLNEEEFSVISRHPIDGALVLAREAALPPVAAVVAFEHHIHLDHSGYPRTRRPRQLHLYSLMTSIVDIYDALTTMRPYRPPLPPQTAVQVMREELSSRLEPRLLARFLEMLGPYPWGTLLRVGGDRLLVVTRPNTIAPDNPLTRIIDADREQVLVEEAPLQEVAPAGAHIEVVDPVVLGIDLTAIMHRAAAAAAEGAH